MGVGWIDRIYNNTGIEWQLQSEDDRNNGLVKKVGGGGQFDLHDKKWHVLSPNTRYTAEWCGIPWYYNGIHQKNMSTDQQNVAEFFTSWRDGANWIYYRDVQTGREIGRQQAPRDDFHCYMRFENDGNYIDILNDAGNVTETLTQIYDEVKGWVQIIVPVLAAAIQAACTASLLERAGGNPLYTEQVCRMLIDRGMLQRDQRTARLAPGADVVFPESIQALITARLDALSPWQKTLLQDAAVVGKVFQADALAVTGRRDDDAVQDGLQHLAWRGFIRPVRGSSVKGEAEYAFWHVLTRDVAYAQLPRAARMRKHRAAAAWIERTAGERVADHAEVLAHHYTSALALARATGATEDAISLQELAARFLVLAGDRAMGLDVARADAYYQRALQHYPPGDPGRARGPGQAKVRAGADNIVSPAPAEEPVDAPVPRFRPLLALVALVVAAAMVLAALGGYSFVGPEAPTPDPTRTPRPAQADAGVGVVVCITSYNVPMTNVMGKIGPALAMGNTVLVKPAGPHQRARRCGSAMARYISGCV